jgi:hypothetical protein
MMGVISIVNLQIACQPYQINVTPWLVHGAQGGLSLETLAR